jgi:hypothetical protein
LSATNPTKGTRHVALVKTQIVSHEWGKNGNEMLTKRTYPWWLTYAKLERKWLWLGIQICYVVLSPFAPISMPCRYSFNKKQRKKGKKAKPVRYISPLNVFKHKHCFLTLNLSEL